jgi:hypothetical protein
VLDRVRRVSARAIPLLLTSLAVIVATADNAKRWMP